MYALIKNGNVAEYPTSINAWRENNRGVSLPEEPTENQLNEVGIFNVVVVSRPSPVFGKVIEELLPTLVNELWTQNWSVRDATTAEVAQQEQALLADIVAATQARLDAFARERGYDDIKSASDYAGCSVPKFSSEGTYCRDARAQTWATLYDMLDEVQAGTRPMPSGFADIEGELPALTWPTP